MVDVESGLLAFTEVPAPAHHRYNAWHQLDHLPEVRALEGIAMGDRWVRTPRCQDATFSTGSELDSAQYFALYLLLAPARTALSGIGRLSEELADAGRSFSDRRGVLSGTFLLVSATAATRVRIRPEAVPFRPATGVYVIVDEPSDGPAHDLTDVDGVVGTWTFASDNDRVSVSWLDDDPATVAGRIATSRLSATTRNAGPFETITAGRWNWFEGHPAAGV